METGINGLLSIASGPIGPPVVQSNQFARWDNLGNGLEELLKRRNGFFAYESALLVRPFQSDSAPLGVLDWNAPAFWKSQYHEKLDHVLFFAEDAFGGQFCFDNDSVCYFDP